MEAKGINDSGYKAALNRNINNKKSLKGETEHMYEDVISQNFEIIGELLKKLNLIFLKQEQFETQIENVQKKLLKLDNQLENIHSQHRRENLCISSSVDSLRVDVSGLNNHLHLFMDEFKVKGPQNLKILGYPSKDDQPIVENKEKQEKKQAAKYRDKIIYIPKKNNEKDQQPTQNKEIKIQEQNICNFEQAIITGKEKLRNNQQSSSRKSSEQSKQPNRANQLQIIKEQPLPISKVNFQKKSNMSNNFIFNQSKNLNKAKPQKSQAIKKSKQIKLEPWSENLKIHLEEQKKSQEPLFEQPLSINKIKRQNYKAITSKKQDSSQNRQKKAQQANILLPTDLSPIFRKSKQKQEERKKQTTEDMKKEKSDNYQSILQAKNSANNVQNLTQNHFYVKKNHNSEHFNNKQNKDQQMKPFITVNKKSGGKNYRNYQHKTNNLNGRNFHNIQEQQRLQSSEKFDMDYNNQQQIKVQWQMKFLSKNDFQIYNDKIMRRFKLAMQESISLFANKSETRKAIIFLENKINKILSFCFNNNFQDNDIDEPSAVVKCLACKRPALKRILNDEFIKRDSQQSTDHKEFSLTQWKKRTIEALKKPKKHQVYRSTDK